MVFTSRLLASIVFASAVLLAGAADAQNSFSRCRGPTNGGLADLGLCSSTEAQVTQGNTLLGEDDRKIATSGELTSLVRANGASARASANTAYGTNIATAETRGYVPALALVPRAVASSDWGDVYTVGGAPLTAVPVNIAGHVHAVYTVPVIPGVNTNGTNAFNYSVGVNGATRIYATSSGQPTGFVSYVQDGHGQIIDLRNGTQTFTFDMPWMLSVSVATGQTFSLLAGLETLSGFSALVADPDVAVPEVAATVDSFTAPQGYTLTSSMSQLVFSNGSYSYAVAAVPEPEVIWMLGFGLSAIVALKRRQRT